MRGARRHAPFAAVIGVLLALPGAALANDFQDVYNEYKRTGTIKPCKFSNQKLQNAERQTPPDVEQYAPSFLDALQNARERGADCNKPAPAAQTPPTTTTPSAAPTPSTPTPAPKPSTQAPVATATTPTPAPPVPAQAVVEDVPSPPLERVRERDDAPAPVSLLAILAALAVLFAVFAGLAWWFGWSADRFTRPWRASWGDFGGRLADTGSEFRDWLRAGH